MADWQPAGIKLAAIFAAPKKAPKSKPVSSNEAKEEVKGPWAAMGIAFFALVAAGILAAMGIVLIPKMMKHKTEDVAKNGEEAAKQDQKDGKDGELSWVETTKKKKHAVAFVSNRYGTGSGFLIRPGILVTNAHVTNPDLIQHLEVTFPSSETNKKHRCELIYEDRNRDLAILKIDTDIAPLSLSAKDPEQSEEIAAIGSPGTAAEGGTSQNAFVKGDLSNFVTLKRNAEDPGLEYYQITAPINHGNSGGPVINRRGHVIGVATAFEEGKQNVNYAIPLRDLRKAVEQSVFSEKQ